MDKTITVLVETYKMDKLYGKRAKYSKKFVCHDENNEAKIGDVVKIMEDRYKLNVVYLFSPYIILD